MKLFDAAFEEKKIERKLFAQEYDVFQKKIEGAKDLLKAMLREEIKVSFYPSEEVYFHPKLEWYSLSLPIREGDEVGKMLVFDDAGKLRESKPIVAIKGVEPTLSHLIKTRTSIYFLCLQKYKTVFAYFGAFILFIICWRFTLRKKESRRAE